MGRGSHPPTGSGELPSLRPRPRSGIAKAYGAGCPAVVEAAGEARQRPQLYAEAQVELARAGARGLPQALRPAECLDHLSARGQGLPQADRLGSADLTGANLTNVILHCADLTGANLEGTRFDGADLDGVIGLPEHRRSAPSMSLPSVSDMVPPVKGETAAAEGAAAG
ncbi:pentapeptide repeat-containing protein [Streptosporangium sp. NPDC002544]|uniref:pentapeptide repeat-containing protein n=1 Tax=Streptosporangium sp. NPDC002544 TaxID=3154538 RepID=UPI003332F3AE